MNTAEKMFKLLEQEIKIKLKIESLEQKKRQSTTNLKDIDKKIADLNLQISSLK